MHPLNSQPFAYRLLVFHNKIIRLSCDLSLQLSHLFQVSYHIFWDYICKIPEPLRSFAIIFIFCFVYNLALVTAKTGRDHRAWLVKFKQSWPHVEVLYWLLNRLQTCTQKRQWAIFYSVFHHSVYVHCPYYMWITFTTCKVKLKRNKPPRSWLREKKIDLKASSGRSNCKHLTFCQSYVVYTILPPSGCKDVSHFTILCRYLYK